jgi:hypothetical protein
VKVIKAVTWLAKPIICSLKKVLSYNYSNINICLYILKVLTAALLQLPSPSFFASASALPAGLPAVPEQHERLHDFGRELAVEPADALQLSYDLATAYIVPHATPIVARAAAGVPVARHTSRNAQTLEDATGQRRRTSIAAE